MNFSEEVKSQILGVKHQPMCCKKALLASFLRTAGSIGIKGGNIGVEMATDIREVADSIAKIITELYGLNPVFTQSDKSSK